MTAPLDLVDRKAVLEMLSGLHDQYQSCFETTRETYYSGQADAYDEAISRLATLPSYPAPAEGAVVPQTIIGVISELEREAASRATGERPRMLAFGTQEIADLLALVQALIAKEAKP